jgi:hypothetical protein
MGEWEKGRLIETKIPQRGKGRLGDRNEVEIPHSGSGRLRDSGTKELRPFETHKPFRI